MSSPISTRRRAFTALAAALPAFPAIVRAAAPFRVLSYAFLTPETASSTHYFWFQLRNAAVADAAVTAEFERLYAATFDEDQVLLEAIERIECAEPGVAPVRIASDTGVARARRVIERRLAAQAQGA
jgi:vanillate O-demethylase monooxygenase subunit